VRRAWQSWSAARSREHVRAGLRNARAKGKRLGRPRVLLDAARIAAPRTQGRSWREITLEMGISRDPPNGRVVLAQKRMNFARPNS